jgi:predicted N-acetyltransferase YhbS
VGEFSFEIRPGTETEFKTLDRIERQAAQRFLEVPELTGMSREQLQETLGQQELEQALSDGCLWVAHVDGRPAGFLAAHLYPNALYVRELDVLEELGRRGIGRSLLGLAIDRARELGLFTVFLRTFRAVPWNAPYYSGLGFEEVAVEEWTAPMKSILKSEDLWGLHADKRVFMARRLWS